MVTKFSLAKKLASYSAIGAAVLAVDKGADAQIVYTKLNPYDTVGYNQATYQLDLNNDGIFDFGFKGSRNTQIVHRGTSAGYYSTIFTYNSDTGIGCKVYNSNKVLLNSTYSISSGRMIKPLNVGDIISEKGTKWGTGYLSLANIRSGGVFTNNWNGKEHYVGLQLLKNGNTYYGWARVYVAKDIQFGLIEEYGYNATPDSPVYAGQECEIEFPTPTIQQNNSTLTTDVNTKVQWYFNNKAIPGDTLQSITTTQYGIYSVTTGDTTICHGTSLPFNYLNCATLQQPVITTTGNVICYDNRQSLQLTDSTPPYYSIQWSLNDSVISYEKGQTSFYTSGGGNYKVIISEQGGCSLTSNSINLVADTNAIYPRVTQSGDTLFTKNYYGNLPSNATMQWYQSQDSIIPGATTSYYIAPDTGIYSVIVIDSLGCSGSSSFDYQICQNLNATITASSNFICSPYGYVSLQASSIPLNYGVEWFLNSSPYLGYGSESEGYNAGTYYAIVSEMGGCLDTTNSIYLSEDTTTMNPVIVQDGDSLIAEPGSRSAFPPHITFQWFNSSNNDSILGDSSYFLPSVNGYYYVVVFDSVGCVGIATNRIYFAATVLTPLNSTDDIQVSESNNLLNIKFINEPYFGYRLSIYNSIGQKIFSSEINSVNTIANLALLAKGLYLVAIEKSNRRVVKKIIID